VNSCFFFSLSFALMMMRVWALFLGLAFVLAATDALRDELPTTLDLYFLVDSYKSKIGDIPSKYLKSYQVSTASVPGTAKFGRSKGSSAEVSTTGLIKPKATVWYKGNGYWTTAPIEGAETRIDYEEGLTVVKVTGTNFTHEINVTVHDYSLVYADDKIAEVLPQIAYSGLTELQKFQNITKWVAHNTDYCVYYQGYTSMLIHQCGDCWASTNTIVAFSKKAGIEATGRRGNQDGGAGSGHMNALAYIGDSFYIGEAGYTGTRPRGWSVYEEPMGFSISGSSIYQYDGKNASVILPSVIGTRNITGLGKAEHTQVFMNSNFEALHFTAGIQTVVSGCLYGEDKLTKITVDPNSEYLEAVDNVLFTKGKKTLIFTPYNKKSVTIPDTTTKIEYTALAHLTLDRLVVPGSVKRFMLAAFYESKIGELIIEDGLENVGETAFQGVSTPKIALPDTVKTMGLAPWWKANVSEVVLPKEITELPVGCFDGCYITHIEIPDKVRDIGEQAIHSNYKLRNVTIPVSVTHVGKTNFLNCPNLTDIYYMGTENKWSQINFETPLPEGITVHFNPDAKDDDDGEVNVAGVVFGVLIGASMLIGVVVGVILAVREKKNGGVSPAKVEAGQAKAAQPASAPAPAPAAAHAPAPAPAPASAPAQPSYLARGAPAPGMYGGSAAAAPAPAARPRPAPRAPAAQNRPAPATPPRGRPAPAPRGRPAPPPRY